MRKFRNFLIVFSLLFVLSSCVFGEAVEEVVNEVEAMNEELGLRGVVLPHHNLVGNYIDEFYSGICDENVDRIVLLSPNHFDSGKHFIQSAEDLDFAVELDVDFIRELEEENVLSVDSVGMNREHGIAVHMNYIEKYFPDVEVVPIMIKWATPQYKLDVLVKSILDEGNMEETLVIASIDFSHYVSEEIALKNDTRTIEWLEDWGDGGISDVSLDVINKLEKTFTFRTEGATALDSPGSFYVLVNLTGVPDDVEIWKRTSSLSLIGGDDPLDNTSHLFVKIW